MRHDGPGIRAAQGAGFHHRGIVAAGGHIELGTFERRVVRILVEAPKHVVKSLAHRQTTYGGRTLPTSAYDARSVKISPSPGRGGFFCRKCKESLP